MTNYRISGELRGSDRAEVWIVDGALAYEAPAGPIEEIRGFAYPGLVDAHTHPGCSDSAVPVDEREALRRIDACRAVGVTHIREMGAQTDVSPLERPGRPKVIRAGQHIARFKRYSRHLAVEVEPSQLAEECATQAARGDGWIKLVGDWIDRSEGADSDLRPLWPRAALIDAFAAAHQAGAKVAVHAFSTEAIDDLIEAGVDSIEHGCGMTRDHLLEAASRGILIDPTIRQISTFPQIAARAGKYPEYRAHMLAMYERREEQLAAMVDVGSWFLMGSDTSANVSERALDVELQWAVECGMPGPLAMAAASFDGRRRLGLPTWEAGAPADIVVYASDPEKDISVTSHPAHVFVDGLDVDW